MPGPAFTGAGADDGTEFTGWAGGRTGGEIAPAGPAGFAVVVTAAKGGAAVVVDGADGGWAQASGADNAGRRSAGNNAYTATTVKTTIPASEIIAIIALSRIENEWVDRCRPQSCAVYAGWAQFNQDHSPFTLKPDAVAQLAALKATVGSNLDKVGAIYLLDEPYGVGRDVSYDDLNTAVNQVRAAFPGKIIMMTLDGPSVVNSQRRIPAGIDWVGFDWYCQGHDTLASTLTTLESRLESPYQRTYLMPESAPLTCRGTNDGGIAAAQQTYVDIAAADPRINCLLNFGWWFSASYGGDMNPLADLPLTAQTQRTLGERIVGLR